MSELVGQYGQNTIEQSNGMRTSPSFRALDRSLRLFLCLLWIGHIDPSVGDDSCPCCCSGDVWPALRDLVRPDLRALVVLSVPGSRGAGWRSVCTVQLSHRHWRPYSPLAARHAIDLTTLLINFQTVHYTAELP
jgi:hypothetical protein